ncbi:PREDICTED: low affinity immunoglobulin gamma Fc region receptor III-B-like [Miniopterus natalensis]|uniref:low affinity immunoglobulin gamma Fc region receptor III-B-like n=1 Tax=Miniopterus natalensis TaxID=291302 RepID=UPI0007A71300|nr:PREDICTED: low affinity immunoglobulin gamma Fc region receptor III-B-like [Miniopterus natalensis]
MWQLLLTAALLLLASSGTQAEDLRKAVVSLYPEWDRLLEKDNVTLRCQGTHTNRHDSTRWWHNGNLLPNQNSSYVISSARVNDSGEYTCQTNLSKLSDPVLLQVHAAWLLLQARQWVAQEGDPIKLRCHSWKNVPVHNVQYFQNGRGVQFSYQNFDFHIPKASGKHNGSYFCRGIIGTLNVSSEAVNIIVQGERGMGLDDPEPRRWPADPSLHRARAPRRPCPCPQASCGATLSSDVQGDDYASFRKPQLRMNSLSPLWLTLELGAD